MQRGEAKRWLLKGLIPLVPLLFSVLSVVLTDRKSRARRAGVGFTRTDGPRTPRTGHGRQQETKEFLEVFLGSSRSVSLCVTFLPFRRPSARPPYQNTPASGFPSCSKFQPSLSAFSAPPRELFFLSFPFSFLGSSRLCVVTFLFQFPHTIRSNFVFSPSCSLFVWET